MLFDFIIQVINFYMGLIMENFDDVFGYSTFFYTKLLSDGYQAVSRWYKGDDVLTKRLLVFPVHQAECSHWCLAVANVLNKQIVYYDSLKKENSICLEVLSSYLHKLGSIRFSRYEDRNIPMQSNGYDCGVFVCLYARYLAERSAFSFNQKDIPAVRKQMVTELLCKKLF